MPFLSPRPWAGKSELGRFKTTAGSSFASEQNLRGGKSCRAFLYGGEQLATGGCLGRWVRGLRELAGLVPMQQSVMGDPEGAYGNDWGDGSKAQATCP